MPPELTACLAPGEKILWEGRPRPYAFLVRGLPHIAYGTTWSILGAYWYNGSGGVGDTAVFVGWYSVLPLFCIPFILAGLSFFFYPIRLGALARRTWYVVTNQRVFIAELKKNAPPDLRLFTEAETCPPHLVKRWDGLQDVILTQSALDHPHLTPRLSAGFFGLEGEGEKAVAAINQSTKTPFETAIPS